ncbi:hypothetical protein OSCI_3100008 [Kamptonema sp. PCC 6506]|nr:hypothetical protein OSCI_3100008 [Kamptonema sp. PCC 6506]
MRKFPNNLACTYSIYERTILNFGELILSQLKLANRIRGYTNQVSLRGL